MAVQGIFLSNQGIVGERQGDFSSAILMTQPTGTAPFLAMSAGMKKEAPQDTVFTWFEDAHVAGRAACVSGGTTTTAVVAAGCSLPSTRFCNSGKLATTSLAPLPLVIPLPVSGDSLGTPYVWFRTALTLRNRTGKR